MVTVARQVVRALRAVRWYARELMGDSAYEHYLARFAVDHADGVSGEHHPLSERDFWRQRSDNQSVSAGCC
jgi:uncharacterized short protein YbdD (DUF466 family)